MTMGSKKRNRSTQGAVSDAQKMRTFASTKSKISRKAKSIKQADGHGDISMDTSGDWQVLLDGSSSEDEAPMESMSGDVVRYEAKSTSSWNQVDAGKLPVKNSDGQIKSVTGGSRDGLPDFSLVHKKSQAKQSSESEDDLKKEDSESKEIPAPDEKPIAEEEIRPTTADEWAARRSKLKVKIADLAEAVMSDPESGFRPSKELENRSCVNVLLSIAKTDMDRSIRKLAILSIVAIFKDVFPGYRINIEAASADKDVKLTKQVKKLRSYELLLLQGYQSLLQLLNLVCVNSFGPPDAPQDHTPSAADSGENQESVFENDIAIEKPSKEMNVDDTVKNYSESIGLVAIRGMCTLLVAKPNANYHENLLNVVIQRMNSTNPDVRSQCYAAVSTLLEEDSTGETTLEVAAYVSRFVKVRNHGLQGSVHPDLCRVLLHCDLKGDLKDVELLKKVKTERKKKSRKRKDADGIVAGLDEAQASADIFQRQSNNAEALREIFGMFLRVLKKASQSLLFPMVLKGIARYVHLINLDLAQALLASLSTLIKNSALGVESSLQVVQTVALTLRGPGIELRIDEGDYIDFLYQTILRLVSSVSGGKRDELVPLVVKCVESTFLGRKLHQHRRVATIVTRLTLLANFVSPHAALALMAVIRTLTTRYSSACMSLFENDGGEVEGQALGLPPVEEADLNGSQRCDGTGLWSLAQLRFHYHPSVRAFAKKALENAPLMPNERPSRLFAAHNPYVDGSFNPPVAGKMKLRNNKSKPHVYRKRVAS